MTPEQASLWAKKEKLPKANWWYTDDSRSAMTINFGLPEEKSLFTETQVREAIAAALVKLTQGQGPIGWRHKKDGHVQWRTEHMNDEVVAKYDNGQWQPLYTHPAPIQQEERTQLAALQEKILDAADEWAGYVEVDTAPMTLRKYLEQAIEAARGKEKGE